MATGCGWKSKPVQRHGEDDKDDDSEDEVFFGAGSEKELAKAARYRKRRTEYYCPDFRVSRVSIFGQGDHGSSGAESFGRDCANIVYEGHDEGDTDHPVEEIAQDSLDESVDKEILVEQAEVKGSKSTKDLAGGCDHNGQAIGTEFNETLSSSGSISSSCEESFSETDAAFNRIEEANDSLVIHQRRSLMADATSRGGSIGSTRDSISDVIRVRESIISVAEEPESKGCQSAISSVSSGTSYVTAGLEFPTSVNGTASILSGGRDGSGSDVDEKATLSGGYHSSHVSDDQHLETEENSSLPLLRLSEVELCLDDAKTGSIETESSLNNSSILLDHPICHANYLSECRLSVNKSKLFLSEDEEDVTDQKDCGSGAPYRWPKVATKSDVDTKSGSPSYTTKLSTSISVNAAATSECSSNFKVDEPSITSLEEAQLAELARLGEHAWLRQTGSSVLSQTDDQSSVACDSLNSTSSLDVVAATMATIRRERIEVLSYQNNMATDGGSGTNKLWGMASNDTACSLMQRSHSSLMVDASLSMMYRSHDHSDVTRDSLDSTSAADGSTLSSLDVVSATMAVLQRERLGNSPQKIPGSPRRSDESWHTAKTKTSSSSSRVGTSSCVTETVHSNVGKVESLDVVSLTMATIERERVASSSQQDVRRRTSESWHTAQMGATSATASLDSSQLETNNALSNSMTVDYLHKSMAMATISTTSKMESDEVIALEEQSTEDSWHTTKIAVGSGDLDSSVRAFPFEIESNCSKSTEESLHTSNSSAAPVAENAFRVKDELNIVSRSMESSKSSTNDSVSANPLPADTFDRGDDSSINDSVHSFREDSPITSDPAVRSTSSVSKSDSKLTDSESPLATSLRSYSVHSVSYPLDSTSLSLDLHRHLHHPDSTSVYESCDNGEDSVASYCPYISCTSTATVNVTEQEDMNEHSNNQTPLAARSSMTRNLSASTLSKIKSSVTGVPSTPSNMKWSGLTVDDSLPRPSTSLQSDSNVEQILSEFSSLNCQSPPLLEKKNMTTRPETSFQMSSARENQDCNTSSQTSFQVSNTTEPRANEMYSQTSFLVLPAAREHVSSNTSSQTSFETLSDEPMIPSDVSEASSGSRIAVGTPTNLMRLAAPGFADRGRKLAAASPRIVVQSPRDNAFKTPVARAAKSPSVMRNARQQATPSPTAQSPHHLGVHKKGRYDNIVSPIGQYINDNPPPPLITNVKQNVARSRLPVSTEKMRPGKPVRSAVAAVAPSVLGPSASPNYTRSQQPSPSPIAVKKGATFSTTNILRSASSRCKENVEVTGGGFRVPQEPQPLGRPTANRKGSSARDDSGLLLEQSILETFGVAKEELSGKLRRDVISHVRKELTRREKATIEQSKLTDRPSEIPVLPYAIYEEPTALASVQKTWDLMTKVHTVKNSKLPVPSPRPIVMKHTGSRKKLQWANAVMATPEAFSSPSHRIRSDVATILVKQGQHQNGGEPAKPNEGEVDVSIVEVHQSTPTYTAGKMKRVLN